MKKGDRISQEQLLLLPRGTIIGHRYGTSFVSDVIKLNSERFIQDVGTPVYLVGPEAYEDEKIVTRLQELPLSGKLVIYSDGGPDFIMAVAEIRAKSPKIFEGKMLREEL